MLKVLDGEADGEVDMDVEGEGCGVVTVAVLVVGAAVGLVLVSFDVGTVETVDVRLKLVEMEPELADTELGLIPEDGVEVGAILPSPFPPARLLARGFPSHG